MLFFSEVCIDLYSTLNGKTRSLAFNSITLGQLAILRIAFGLDAGIIPLDLLI